MCRKAPERPRSDPSGCRGRPSRESKPLTQGTWPQSSHASGKYHKEGVESDGEATSFFTHEQFIHVDKIPVPGTPKSLGFELIVGVQWSAGLQTGQGSFSGDSLEIHDLQVTVTQST